MEQKPHSRRAWIAWIVLGLAAFYPLSFGPAYWIAVRLKDPAKSFEMLGVLYRPVIIALIESPEPVRYVAAGYLSLGSPSGQPMFFFHDTSSGLVSEHPGFTYTWLSY